MNGICLEIYPHNIMSLAASINNSIPRVVPQGLVLWYDAARLRSYAGSGTSWNDLSGNAFTGTLTNGPTFSTSNGGRIVLDGTNDWVSLPGNGTIYSSDFTWQSFHYINSANAGDLDAMWWSEAGTKNFLTGYRNTGTAGTYFRIDTPSTVYQSPSVGTQSNGFGTTAGPATGRWLLTTITKSGSSFSLYWNAAVLMWNVTISDWNISATSQAIAFGARNDSAFATNMNVSSILMYNRALSTTEITQNFNADRLRYGL